MAEVLDQHFSSVDSSVDSKGCTKLDFSEEEIDLITRMYILVGDRWSIIAGRIPGRSAEEIEKYWILTHLTGQRVKLAKGV